MSSQFDDLARTLASPMPRRGVLRVLGSALVVTVLPGLRPRSAHGAALACPPPTTLCSNGKGSDVCLDVGEECCIYPEAVVRLQAGYSCAAAASTTPASTSARTGARTASAARRARAAASRAPAARSSARPSRRARAARASRAVRPERSPSQAPPESAVRREIWIAASPRIRTPTMIWLRSRRSSSEDSCASRARSGGPEPQDSSRCRQHRHADARTRPRATCRPGQLLLAGPGDSVLSEHMATFGPSVEPAG